MVQFPLLGNTCVGQVGGRSGFCTGIGCFWAQFMREDAVNDGASFAFGTWDAFEEASGREHGVVMVNSIDAADAPEWTMSHSVYRQMSWKQIQCQNYM